VIKQSELDALAEAASTVMEQAYAPYSGYRVGAAIMAESGRIFTGCNVENVSYGLTICAERSAIFQAVAAGARKFRALAVVSDAAFDPYPCGACRQVLAEFCDPEMPVHVFRAHAQSADTIPLAELLPKAFGG